MAKIKKLLLITLLLFLPVSAHAAVGDTVNLCATVLTTDTLDIQPGAGVEWLVQSIKYESTIDLQQYDGSITLTYASYTGPDMLQVTERVTNTNRIRVKNTNVASKNVCYSAIVTKQ